MHLIWSDFENDSVYGSIAEEVLTLLCLAKVDTILSNVSKPCMTNLHIHMSLAVCMWI